MKKNYFYLTGLAIILLLNFLISYLTKNHTTENINNINLYAILKQSLHPSAIFLLINFFNKKSINAPLFSIFIFALIIIEFIFRYFKEKDIIEYNYVIGMFVGLLFVFLIDWFKNKLILDVK